MSNQQLPWDVNRNKDRLNPRELPEGDKAKMEQEESGEHDPQDERWVPPGNSNQGSRKD